jgi:carboxypeptidase Taq
MSYEHLRATFARHAAIGEVSSVLNWDMQTCMPKGGAEARGRQIAELRAMSNDLLADARMGDWLAAAEADEQLDTMQRANVAEMRRAWTHETATSASLVRELSEAGTRCFVAWQTARAENDFASLLPLFDRVLQLTREAAAAKGEALGLAPYDAMIDGFTPGLTAREIDAIFAPLRAELPGLLTRVIEHQATLPQVTPLTGPFPAEKQKQLGERLMAAVGFDFNHGRLDVSHHPFCGGIPSDVRITTRYDEHDLLSGLMGVLHETGHAMYERQLPEAWSGQPVGDARGMAMHESQSLLVEMQVCRSPAFIAYAAPIMAEMFGGDAEQWSVANLTRHYHHVERSLIRVDADEVSYPLHVILRFELERKLIDGSLSAADLPDAWREGMERLIGVVPPDDRNGCMQDIHWMDGAYGYFPAYSLGAIAANQLYAAARRAHPEIEGEVRNGTFTTLMAWLKTHVHERASSVSSHELLRDATGRSFDGSAYLAYLEERYLAG